MLSITLLEVVFYSDWMSAISVQLFLWEILTLAGIWTRDVPGTKPICCQLSYPGLDIENKLTEIEIEIVATKNRSEPVLLQIIKNSKLSLFNALALVRVKKTKNKLKHSSYLFWISMVGHFANCRILHWANQVVR